MAYWELWASSPQVGNPDDASHPSLASLAGFKEMPTTPSGGSTSVFLSNTGKPARPSRPY